MNKELYDTGWISEFIRENEKEMQEILAESTALEKNIIKNLDEDEKSYNLPFSSNPKPIEQPWKKAR